MKLLVLAGVILICAVQAFLNKINVDCLNRDGGDLKMNITSPISADDSAVSLNLESFGLKDLLEALKTIAKNLVKEISRVVKDSNGDLTAIVDNGLEAIVNSSEATLREIQKVIDEIRRQQIENLPEGTLKKCLEVFEPRVAEVSDLYYATIRACADSARVAIVAGTIRVNEILQELRETSADLVSDIQQCAEDYDDNLQVAVVCAVEKIQNAKKLLGTQLGELRRALTREGIQVVKTVRTAKSCLNKTQDEATRKIRNIAADISECQKSECDSSDSLLN